jgi:hypothetical protein
LPEAIGGGLTLNDTCDNRVCRRCNTGVLSDLDRELCSRSYLSSVASQEIDAHIWQAWDVDHSSNNLLIEARPKWDGYSLERLILYPQITFEKTGPEFRGDMEEMRNFGAEDFAKVIARAGKRAFQRHIGGKKGAINRERIQSGVIHDGYRLAPRLFFRHSINEIAADIDGQSPILRFVTPDDMNFALKSLSSLTETPRVQKCTSRPGSSLPTFAHFFDIGKALRALMKLGLNLVAAYCHNTPVNHDTFNQVIRLILGEGQINPNLSKLMGFVRADDLKCIRNAGGAHTFRLVHLQKHWHVYAGFFGGRIGSYVFFPGPKCESWSCADIVAPIRSKDWKFTAAPITESLPVTVEWKNLAEIVPTFELHKSVASISVDVVADSAKPRT